MESLSPDVQELITKVARDRGIENFTVNVNNSVSKAGDGYIGILEAVYIKDKDSDKTLNLVAKKAPASANLRKQFPTRPAFLREIILYHEVLPEFESFQEEHNIPHPFNSVTKIHGFIRDEFKEVLFLNNLKEEGFRLCDRTKPLDPHHLSLVLTTYAKFHAISYAMKKLEPERFERVTEKARFHIMAEFRKLQPDFPQLHNLDGQTVHPMISAFFTPTLKAVKDNPRLVAAMDNVIKQFDFDFMESQEQDEFAVLSHTDCWSANMLFKYEDESNPNIPTKVTLIDWQMSCIAHPVHDISYFFYISAGKSDLWNYIRYLNVYHTAFCENLTAFGLDPISLYPFEHFEKQWKERSKAGFYMCQIMLQQSLSETKTHDFVEMADSGQNLFESPPFGGDTISDRFKERMGDLVEFLVEHEFI